MNKKQLSEQDIRTKYITPALTRAGWDIQTQIREEFALTQGRIVVRGKLHTRAQNKRADYVLFYKPNIPIAIIEAKDNNHALGDGTIERELSLHEFPSPNQLWQWWARHQGLTEQQESLVIQDYYSDSSNKIPRYYQLLAINKTIETRCATNLRLPQAAQSAKGQCCDD